MTERVEAAVTPALLVWAREDDGFNLHEAAKRLACMPRSMKITSSDVADFLKVRLNHLGKIEHAVGETSSASVL